MSVSSAAFCSSIDRIVRFAPSMEPSTQFEIAGVAAVICNSLPSNTTDDEVIYALSCQTTNYDTSAWGVFRTSDTHSVYARVELMDKNGCFRAATDNCELREIHLDAMWKVGEHVTMWQLRVGRIHRREKDVSMSNKPDALDIPFATICHYRTEDAVTATKITWRSSSMEMTQHRSVIIRRCASDPPKYSDMRVFNELPTSYMLPTRRPYSGCLTTVSNLWGYNMPQGSSIQYISTTRGDFLIASIGTDFILCTDTDMFDTSFGTFLFL